MAVVDWVEIIAICMIVIAASIMFASIAIVLLALRLRKSVGTLTIKVQPLISQATETAKTAKSIAETAKSHADGILNKAENTVDVVTRKVKTTTNVLQDSLNPPIVTVASVLTGVSRGLEVLSQMRKRGGNGHA